MAEAEEHAELSGLSSLMTCMTMNNTLDLFTSRISVYRVELVCERMMDGPIVTTPGDVAPIACDYLKRADREHFVVLILATNGRVTGIHTAHIGSLSASIVRVADVFKVAILANAASIVVFHNHPSGNLEPSQEDIRITKRLIEAGKLLEVPVLDHLIVGHNGRYTSLAERGLL